MGPVAQAIDLIVSKGVMQEHRATESNMCYVAEAGANKTQMIENAMGN